MSIIYGLPAIQRVICGDFTLVFFCLKRFKVGALLLSELLCLLFNRGLTSTELVVVLVYILS